ncbi:MAG: poly-gamma-glutamate hydrolase family protein [Acidimicrobiales bacterium]
MFVGGGQELPSLRMFEELLAHPGVEEIGVLRSTFGFMAFHGGSLEQVTDDIALAAAERGGASVYAVVQPPGFRWHLPSTQIDPAHSPVLAAFLEHVDVVVAVHGFGRQDMFTTLLLGGRNRELGRHVGRHLQSGLPGYEIVDALERIPKELRGLHPENPVNRPRQGGVQLELPPRVRGLGPFWADFRAEHGDDAHPPHTEALIDALADAATTWTP